MIAVVLAVVLALAGCAGAPPRPAPPPDGFRSEFATVNGFAMHYVIGGSGPAVVLIHGWPVTWFSWRHVMPALARDHTVIAVDQRGLGDSEVTPAGYDDGQRADDVDELVTGLGFTRFDVVAHDFGGPTGYALAAGHPDQVRSLTLIETAVCGLDFDQLQRGAPQQFWYVWFQSVADLPDELVAGREREYLTWFYRHDGTYVRDFPAADTDEFVRAYSRPGSMRAGFELYRSCATSAGQNRALAGRGKLAMPVLVMGGDHGFGEAALAGPRTYADDVTFRLIPGAGHWAMTDNGPYVADQIRAFLPAAR